MGWLHPEEWQASSVLTQEPWEETDEKRRQKQDKHLSAGTWSSRPLILWLGMAEGSSCFSCHPKWACRTASVHEGGNRNSRADLNPSCLTALEMGSFFSCWRWLLSTFQRKPLLALLGSFQQVGQGDNLQPSASTKGSGKFIYRQFPLNQVRCCSQENVWLTILFRGWPSYLVHRWDQSSTRTCHIFHTTRNSMWIRFFSKHAHMYCFSKVQQPFFHSWTFIWCHWVICYSFESCTVFSRAG